MGRAVRSPDRRKIVGSLAALASCQTRATTGLRALIPTTSADHNDTRRSPIEQVTRDLAFAYQDAGRLDQAIPLLERALIDAERMFGVTHPDTLTTRNDLAAAYQAVGRLQEADSLRNHNEPKP